jgi:hypothetical protein
MNLEDVKKLPLGFLWKIAGLGGAKKWRVASAALEIKTFL